MFLLVSWAPPVLHQGQEQLAGTLGVRAKAVWLVKARTFQVYAVSSQVAA